MVKFVYLFLQGRFIQLRGFVMIMNIAFNQKLNILGYISFE